MREKIEEQVFKSQFPNEEYDPDDFNDWVSENPLDAYNTLLKISEDLANQKQPANEEIHVVAFEKYPMKIGKKGNTRDYDFNKYSREIWIEGAKAMLSHQHTEQQKEAWVSIEKWKFLRIWDAIRLTYNIYDVNKKDTAWKRLLGKAWGFVNEIKEKHRI